MSEKLGQEPAFPLDGRLVNMKNKLTYSPEGMSKRFYAACAAMQGLLSNHNTAHQIQRCFNNKEVSSGMANEVLIKTAFNLADELLKQENL